jgi:hypothetical protein
MPQGKPCASRRAMALREENFEVSFLVTYFSGKKILLPRFKKNVIKNWKKQIMPLSWNEIKTRAAAFVLEWKDSQTVREKAEAQTFETEFLKIFGVNRKKAALFEHEVRFGDGGERGYIDLFWKGRIIIEMKTPRQGLGQSLRTGESLCPEPASKRYTQRHTDL